MDSITLKRDGLDESINELEEGETMEIHGTFTVVSKSDTEIVGELTDVKKCGHMGDDEYELDEDGGEDEGGEYEEAPKDKPKKSGKKGMGILIMIGGPKKK